MAFVVCCRAGSTEAEHEAFWSLAAELVQERSDSVAFEDVEAFRAFQILVADFVEARSSVVEENEAVGDEEVATCPGICLN